MTDSFVIIMIMIIITITIAMMIIITIIIIIVTYIAQFPCALSIALHRSSYKK